MIIGSRTKLTDITEFKVEVNDILLKWVNKTRCLGVIIDDELKWNYQMYKVVSTVQAKLGMLYGKWNNIISIDSVKMHYDAFILPHFDYCSQIWAELVLSKGYDTPIHQVHYVTHWVGCLDKSDSYTCEQYLYTNVPKILPLPLWRYYEHIIMHNYITIQATDDRLFTLPTLIPGYRARAVYGSIWFHDWRPPIVTWAWSMAKGQYMVSWLLTGAPEQRYWQNRDTANIGLVSSVGRAPIRHSRGRRFKSRSSNFVFVHPKFIKKCTQSVSFVVHCMIFIETSRIPSGASLYCLFPGCIVTWAWSMAKGQYMVSWLLTGAPEQRYWQNRETANIGL